MIKYYYLFFIVLIIIIIYKYFNFYNGGSLNKLNYPGCNNTKHHYIKKACEFIGLIDFGSQAQIDNFIKFNYLIKGNIQENIAHIYYSLIIPLKILVGKTNNKYISLLEKKLRSFDKRYYDIFLFELHNLFSPYQDNKIEWVKKFDEYRIKNQTSANYDKLLTDFLQYSIDPNNGKLFIKLYDMTNNNNEWKSFLAEINKANIDIKDLYPIKSANLKNNPNLISLIENRLSTLIEENEGILGDLFVKYLLKLGKTTNIYNSILNNVSDKISTNLHFYNKICKYRKNSFQSCPLNIKIGKNTIDCNKNIIKQFEIPASDKTDNDCNKCEYEIKNCKIKLKCNDINSINNNIFKNLPAGTTTTIEQNRCKLNLGPKNTEKIIIREKTNNISAQQPTYMRQFDTCKLTKADLIARSFNNVDLTIKYKRLFILNNQLLTYIYFPLKYLFPLYLNYHLTSRLHNIIGYTGLKTSSSQPVIIKYNYNKFESEKCTNKNECSAQFNNLDTYFLQNKFDILFSSQRLKLGAEWLTILDDMYIDIEIGLGGKGGGKSSPLIEESDNDNSRLCPGDGGNTVLKFGINNRDYNWDGTIIAHGGKIQQKNNDKLVITNLLGNRVYNDYFNTGSSHLFYDRMSISGGGGGGCFNQLQFLNKNYNSPFLADTGNPYHEVNLNTFDSSSKQLYLYQESNQLKTSISYKKSQIKGGDGGLVSFSNKSLYQGSDATSFGCGGGGGAKRNTSDNFTIGGGGAGKMGAIIILNHEFKEVYNSTDIDSGISSGSLTKTLYLKDLKRTDSNGTEHELNKGEIFYIISIGAGAGGMSGLVTGIGGNGGNLIISRHLYEQPFDTTNRDVVLFRDTLKTFKNFIDNWKSEENNYYQTNVKKLIRQILLNNYINKCNDSFCSISKISEDNEIHNFMNINKKSYFGFLHSSALLFKNIITNYNTIYKLYSINNDGTTHNYKYNIKLTRSNNSDSYTHFNIELFDKDTNKLIHYKTNVYIKYYVETKSVNLYCDNTNPNDIYWKTNNILKNNIFSNSNNIKFLNDNNRYNFRFFINTDNVSDSIWPIYNSILINSVQLLQNQPGCHFECTTSMNPEYLSENYIYFVSINPLSDNFTCINYKHRTDIELLINQINHLYYTLNIMSDSISSPDATTPPISTPNATGAPISTPTSTSAPISIPNTISSPISTPDATSVPVSTFGPDSFYNNILTYKQYHNTLKQKIQQHITNYNDILPKYSELNITNIDNIIANLDNIINNYSTNVRYTIPRFNIILHGAPISTPNATGAPISTPNATGSPISTLNVNSGSSELECDIQIPIVLSFKEQVSNTNKFIYTGHIYNNIVNNIVTLSENMPHILQTLLNNNYKINYIKENDILRINSIYLSEKQQDEYLNVNQRVELINNSIYIISITDIFNTLKSGDISYENFRSKIQKLNSLYPVTGNLTYYFTFNTTNKKNITLNKTYNIKQYVNNTKQFKIKFVDKFLAYDIIIINSNLKDTFEEISIYQFFEDPLNTQCENSTDIYNIRTFNNIPEEDYIEGTDNQQQICCNTINFKNTNLCSINNKTLCWFNGNICNSNFIKITYIDNNKYYFNLTNIPDYNSGELRLKVNVNRNFLPIANNILISLFKEEDSLVSNIENEIKQQEFYIMGYPDLIENSEIRSNLDIISDKLKLFNNLVNINDDKGNQYNQLKFVNTYEKSVLLTNNILLINFTLKISVNYLTIYYNSNTNIDIDIILIDSITDTQVGIKKVTLQNSESAEKKQKIEIPIDRIDKIQIQQNREQYLARTFSSYKYLFIRNISIFGKQIELPSNVFKGFFTVSDTYKKLKINDDLVFKNVV